mmetsp:Transcript_43643/g.75932  ORF Transcript_43643/g.75932 Transcript_43643/m.75932 type:complete len:263 (+) Transcript_43643:253-1041(+)
MANRRARDGVRAPHDTVCRHRGVGVSIIRVQTGRNGGERRTSGGNQFTKSVHLQGLRGRRASVTLLLLVVIVFRHCRLRASVRRAVIIVVGLILGIHRVLLGLGVHLLHGHVQTVVVGREGIAVRSSVLVTSRNPCGHACRQASDPRVLSLATLAVLLLQLESALVQHISLQDLVHLLGTRRLRRLGAAAWWHMPRRGLVPHRGQQIACGDLVSRNDFIVVRQQVALAPGGLQRGAPQALGLVLRIGLSGVLHGARTVLSVV